MVFKIMRAAATFHGVDYNEKKQKAGLASNVYFENFGYLSDRLSTISKEQFKKFLQDYSATNTRVSKPQFHAILSCQGNTRSFEELKVLSLQIMHGLGYKETPILIYEHHDTRNNHVHIITSRIGLDKKKIPDYNEGKRAQVILNSLLELNPKQQYEKDLGKALSYNINSSAQFLLLMERAGYKKSEQGNEFIFHKYGERQGAVSMELIDQKIRQDKEVKRNTAKIKALIYKYKNQYRSIVSVNEPFLYSSAPKAFESELTNYLNKTFGLEFIFFASKGHEQPYGYTVLDHKNTIAYKGSEIMKLEVLQEPGNKPEEKNLTEAKIAADHMQSAIPGSSDTVQETVANNELLEIWNAVIDSGLKDNELYSQRSSKASKKGKPKRSR